LVPLHAGRYGYMEGIRVQHDRLSGGAYGHQPDAVRSGGRRRRRTLEADTARNAARDVGDHHPAHDAEPRQCAKRWLRSGIQPV